jgi:hypothetical protein
MYRVMTPNLTGIQVYAIFTLPLTQTVAASIPVDRPSLTQEVRIAESLYDSPEQ